MKKKLWAGLASGLIMMESIFSGTVIKKRYTLVLALLILIIATSDNARATTIASQTGDLYAVFVNDPIILSWTQPDAYSNVTVSAIVSSNDFFLPGAGQVWLTTRVGPGTTPADTIASAAFSNVPFAQTTFTSIFSGLTLGPDTYYLVLSANGASPGLGWGYVFPAAVSTAPGVTTDVLLGNGVADFPPASPGLFQNQYAYIAYTITGNPVPEPTTIFLFGTGIACLAGTRIRGKKN
jgi:hypothetical protein